VSVNDLPANVLLMVLAYTSDADYRDETMDYEPDVHPNVDRLLNTCGLWRDLILHNWGHFLRLQRRSQYLSKLF